jgi:kynureninase
MLIKLKNTLDTALLLDEKFAAQTRREDFFIPQKNGKEVIYFTGNSLGLQPKSARKYIELEMTKWQENGVEGHFGIHEQWYDYHKMLRQPLANLVGANPLEVVAMNTLTVNLHLLMASFFRPQGKRTKILMEASAFPSDQYVAESQSSFHGLDPEQNVVEFVPREGELILRTEDMVAKIKEVGDELALILLGGVNYYTGQFFDIEAISKAGHEVGAVVGLDLAHTVGNLPLKLHDWQIDFAAWCSYKYLNSSPGGISGVFVHQKHNQNPELPRLTGWWGYEESTRFKMKKGFVPEPNIDAWQMSNAPILLLAAHRAALEMIEEVGGVEALRHKSKALTGFLESVILDISQEENYPIQIITPSNQENRGCQLSLLVKKQGRTLFEKLEADGVIGDWREPDVIRLAPVPLYNTFEEMFEFGEMLRKAIQSL